MNRVFYIVLTTLIICPAAQAIDLKTDVFCKKLVTAITQAQELGACTAAWQTIATSAAIATQDHAAIIEQALQLTQEQKTALELALNTLGDETRNYSKLKWGAGQLALGGFFVMGELYAFIAWYKRTSLANVLGYQLIWPEVWFAKDAVNGEPWIPESHANISIGLRTVAINPAAAAYCFYKAYHNLKQGFNYKKFLLDKITNLDAIISYLQELQRII